MTYLVVVKFETDGGARDMQREVLRLGHPNADVARFEDATGVNALWPQAQCRGLGPKSEWACSQCSIRGVGMMPYSFVAREHRSLLPENPYQPICSAECERVANAKGLPTKHG